ncbi:PilZ domain-containing protein [Sphingobium nicotianae]|uniref:PilZ domain-containing protein n=1 Tax=Sphingobium nicotianae TaxID=2782607 RepID=A0A9X1DD36_9SPHN|nr:PilZ domain-containing protein [Sphingobium nicotianae]MBT2187701.1 PilZ domain-containing protein [Sphingobium nicotianae]
MAEPAKKFEQGQEQRRQSVREPVDLPTSVVRRGREPQPVRLVDISPFGLHARFHGNSFARGEHLHIELPLIGPVKAQVMWGLKGCFGCKFLMPIDARTFLRLLAAMRSGQDGPSER